MIDRQDHRNEIAEGEKGKGNRFRFRLREFLIYGLIWITLNVTILGIWRAGTFTLRQVRRIQQLIEWTETLPFGGDEKRFPFFDRWGKGRDPLERWIRANRPRVGEGETEAAARAFGETASMLRAGDLRGERDAFAELTSRLETAVTRARWQPFLVALSERLVDELPADPRADEVADLLERAAGALRADLSMPPLVVEARIGESVPAPDALPTAQPAQERPADGTSQPADATPDPAKRTSAAPSRRGSACSGVVGPLRFF
ncbi:MAG: hypothetical protein ACOX6D_06380 [Thermoguttaceae bacterium]|jgi:hypothetical protein